MAKLTLLADDISCQHSFNIFIDFISLKFENWKKNHYMNPVSLGERLQRFHEIMPVIYLMFKQKEIKRKGGKTNIIVFTIVIFSWIVAWGAQTR